MTGAQKTTRVAAAALVAVLASAGLAVAQEAARATVDARFDALVQRKWTALLEAEVASAKQPSVAAWRANVPAEARRAAYERVVTSLSSDADLLTVFDRAYVQSLIDEKAESRLPVSTNATVTNPVTAGLAERSGGTALAAIGADLSSVVSADKSAVSLSLSALALVSAKDPAVYSSIAAYQDHELARRFTGTVTFGAKIPEKALTGLSGVPDADTLFDAVAWDVKVRVAGDKDVRSSRWSDLSVRQGGMKVQLAGLLPTIALDPGPTASAEAALQLVRDEGPLILPLLRDLTGSTAKDVVERAAKSAQLSLKVAGTHLTKESGKNKYSFAALFDSGVGPADITANVQYSVTDDVSLGKDRLFQVKQWTLAASLAAHLAPDAIVAGRTLDWNLGANATMFRDANSMPVPAKNTWKLFTSLEIPVGTHAKLPLTIIYSNDPNALTKTRYVSGLIGLSYDFSALKSLALK